MAKKKQKTKSSVIEEAEPIINDEEYHKLIGEVIDRMSYVIHDVCGQYEDKLSTDNILSAIYTVSNIIGLDHKLSVDQIVQLFDDSLNNALDITSDKDSLSSSLNDEPVEDPPVPAQTKRVAVTKKDPKNNKSN